jgi:hypothetical protein
MTEEVVSGVQEPIAEVQQTQQVSDREENLRALRQKSEELEAHNRAMQAKLFELERAQQKQQQPNYSDDDVPTWGELRRAQEAERQEMHRLKEELNDMRMRSRYQDYETTIKEYLPDVLTEEPDLAQAIKDNPMMHRLAYKLAQASPRYHQERLAKANEATVNKIVENTSRPQPANSRKSVGGYDEDSKLSAMSDGDIMAIFNMAKARS